MVISILTRKTRINDRAERQKRLAAVLPRITDILQSSPGFASLQYLWDVHEEGAIAQITSWNSDEDCRRYVREGAAATVATIEESLCRQRLTRKARGSGGRSRPSSRSRRSDGPRRRRLPVR